jgi:hypothetical protein
MAVIEKGGLIFIPLVISVLLGFVNGTETKREPKNDLEIQMDNYEKYLDSCIIAKSSIIGQKAIVKDSTAKVLTKVCNVLKTEVKVLKFENKELKSDLQVLSKKAPDTILKTVYIKKGLFGGIDTLND